VRSLLGSERWRPSPLSPSAPNTTTLAEADRKNSAIALKIWDEATDPRGTVVETYLRVDRRGLELDRIVAGQALRFHPALELNGRRWPAMVALFRDIITDQPCGIHRTFLTADGQKLGRKMLGRSRDAAIKLDPDDAVTTGLAIGEGIETVLTGRVAGFRPAWALGASGKIATFPKLAGIDALTVHVEVDQTGASQKALNKCAPRWLAAGREVIPVWPRLGKDLNDLLRRDAR
jgi:hypothetical protein